MDDFQVEMKLVHDVPDDASLDASNVPDSELAWSKSVCTYCGVGCGLLAGTKDGRLHKVRGDSSHPANQGMICAKGATLSQLTDSSDRLLYPLTRASRDAAFSRVSWDEAASRVAAGIRGTIDKHGPDSFAFYISGQLMTEDYYVVNKLAKGFLGTNNVDSNSRLCMSSAVAGYSTSLGADGPPACYADIELADCFFLIGTNTASCHPVTFARIKARRAKNPSVRVIVADPRRTATADISDIFLPLRPGTDVALLNGMLHTLEREHLLDEAFLGDHVSGWPEARAALASYTPEHVSRICGIPAQQIREAALVFGRAQSALSFWSMGLNQSTSGVAKNNSVINLHLATGKIGKPGSGPFSLTGQPNAMGGRETGGLSHLLPGHRLIVNASHRRDMENHWGVPPDSISPKPGLSAVELFRALEDGRVKVVWVLATNPMVSLPNGSRVAAALRKAELVIVQDPCHPTETTQMADILLPAAQWSEREATVTNSERRISYLSKLVDAPGEAKPDWRIVCEVAARLGFRDSFAFRESSEVFDEYVRSTRGTDMDLTGVSYERLRKGPLQWPCPPESAGTPRLYTDHRFPTADGRARLLFHEFKPPAEATDKEFPFVLTTGRVRDQWHSMTRTGRIDALLRAEPYAFLEIHPADADRLSLADGEDVRVVTRRGEAAAPARVTDRVPQGTCFMPFHWGALYGDAVVNRATQDAFDPVSKQPELKFSACRIEKADGRLRAEGF